jgi:hypothetical protein
MLFYRAALPLSRKTLDFATGIIRRHRKAIGSRWRKLDPGAAGPAGPGLNTRDLRCLKHSGRYQPGSVITRPVLHGAVVLAAQLTPDQGAPVTQPDRFGAGCRSPRPAKRHRATP